MILNTFFNFLGSEIFIIMYNKKYILIKISHIDRWDENYLTKVIMKNHIFNDVIKTGHVT